MKIKVRLMMLLGIAFVMLYGTTGYAEGTGKIVLPTNVTVASEGNTIVGVEGSFADDISEAIKLVNKYRLEACENGYPDPRDPERKLTKSDYVPINWSSELEYIARIRAAEASFCQSHTRPNGKSCFSISAPNGIDSYAEVLAWGGDTICGSASLWYSEKEIWIKRGKGVTGHYTSMINPSTTYMGMANFNGTGAGEFSSDSWVNFGSSDESSLFHTQPLEEAKNVIQAVEVSTSDLSGLKPVVDKKMIVGEDKTIELKYNYKDSDYTELCYLGNIEWSGDSDKIDVLPDGRIKADNIGKHKVKITYSGDISGSFTSTIMVSPKNTKIKKLTSSKNSIKITLEKVSGISGYQIKYMYGSFWNPVKKTINLNNKTTVKTIKKLNRKTEYGFYVRTYKKVNGKKYYSDWSEYKGVKTK